MARGAATPIPRRAGARTPIVEAMAVILGKDAAQFRVSFVPQLIGMMLSPDPTWWYRHERQAPTPGQPPPLRAFLLPLVTMAEGLALPLPFCARLVALGAVYYCPVIPSLPIITSGGRGGGRGGGIGRGRTRMVSPWGRKTGPRKGVEGWILAPPT